MTTAGSPSALDLKGETAAPEADYARWDDGNADVPLILLPGTTPGAPLAALVIFGDEELDRAEAVVRFCLRRLGRTAPDRRLTPFRRRRIPMELRAADARFEGASYREIAEAIHGHGRVADEDDWRSSPLRNEAIDLVAGGKALIAGGYRKLFRHRRRP